MIPSTMYVPTYTVGRICYPLYAILFLSFYGTCVSYQIVGTNYYTCITAPLAFAL